MANELPETEGVQSENLKRIIRPQCSALSKGGGRCLMPAEYRSQFCLVHKAVHNGARNKVEHKLYARKDFLAPKVKDLYEAFLQDPDLMNLNHEVAVLKSYFYIYLETCSERNLIPDPKALAIYIETMGRSIERSTGKKFQLTVNGTAMLIERICVILENNMLDDYPDLLQQIVKQMGALRLDPDDLEGTSSTGQLKVAHGADVVKGLKRADD